MLTLVILWPLLGALLIALLPRTAVAWPRRVAAGVTGSLLLSTVGLTVWLIGAAEGFREARPWIPELGIGYHLALDGLNAPLVLLTAFLTFIAVLGSWAHTDRPHLYFSLLLLLEAGVLGVFLAFDLLLFFLFWELELIPMYFLIGLWGGPRREYAAIKFVLYTLTGSVLLLAGLLLLYIQSRPPTTDLLALTALVPHLAPEVRTLVCLLFLGNFAVKLPIFPFHTWLPDAHVEAPTPVSVLLAGVLLKLGGYGLVRLNVGLFPEVVRDLSLLLGVLAVVNVLYGAAVSLVQRDLKALVAYSSISHMGYVLLGLAALTPVALSGAVFQMVSHGLITGLLFLLVGALAERTHTREIAALGGLAGRLPRLATGFVLAGLAALGLPGMSGFVAEFLVLVGAFGRLPVLTLAAAGGLVLAAGDILWLLQRVFFGPLRPQWATLTDLRAGELVPVVLLLLAILGLGLYPAPLLAVIASGLGSLGQRAAL